LIFPIYQILDIKFIKN